MKKLFLVTLLVSACLSCASVTVEETRARVTDAWQEPNPDPRSLEGFLYWLRIEYLDTDGSSSSAVFTVSHSEFWRFGMIGAEVCLQKSREGLRILGCRDP